MKTENKKSTTVRHIGRDERIIRENGGAELFDDPQFAPYCRLVSGHLAITEAQRLDYSNMRRTRGLAAAHYYLIAMILIRAAENYLDKNSGSHRLRGIAATLYHRAAYAMRQSFMAHLLFITNHAK